MEAEEETEKIAQHFEAIFGQNDVKPTIEEEAKLKSNIDTLESRVKTENKPPFTERELDQAIRKANMRSAKGPDGIANRLIKAATELPIFKN